jgi:hypothetical protein
MMLFGPGVKNMTAEKTMKAKKSCCDMVRSRDLSDDLFLTGSSGDLFRRFWHGAGPPR